MIENKNTQKAVGAVIIIVLIGFVGWYIARDFSLTDTDTIEDGSIESLVESGDAEVNEIPVGVDLNIDAVVRPELGRAVVMPERFSSEAIVILLNNIATLTEQLKEDSNSFHSWSDLAAQYKIIDDFEGAKEIWEFLITTAKENVGPYINLGNLYHYQLKDYEKAESAFKDALNINDKLEQAYSGLHELYRYSYKIDTTLAVDILKEGVVAIPDSVDLRMLLASYYTKLGMNDDARAVYEEVLIMANTAGDTNLVTIVEAAIESLK
ncbi:tetratricopeptide repeat protein [candidate division KSB1 bacterium]